MELKLPLTIEECHNYIKSQKELLEVLTACVNKQALEILELKELLTRNSQNSSKPSPQDNRKIKPYQNRRAIDQAEVSQGIKEVAGNYWTKKTWIKR